MEMEAKKSRQATFSDVDLLDSETFVEKIHTGELKKPKDGWNLILTIIWKLIEGIIFIVTKKRKEISDLKAENKALLERIKEIEKHLLLNQ